LLAAEPEEHRLVTALEQLIDIKVAAQLLAKQEPPAEIGDDVGLHRKRVFRQPVARNTDLRHAAGLVGLFEDIHDKAAQQEVIGTGNARGPRAGHRDLLALVERLGLHVMGEFQRVRSVLQIGHVAFERLDPDRVVGNLRRQACSQ